MSRVRTRFAPSPTGSLHVGNARMAVLNWAVARHHGGDFILRIEDTDAERNVPGAERALLRDLAWLGLDWDEGPDPEGEGERGDRGPYRQSRRLPLYRRHRDALLASGRAYRCFCSAETLEAERSRALAEGRAPRYAGTCRDLAADRSAERDAAGDPYVVRLATPERGEIVVDDVIRGRVVFDASGIGDFILVRSDGLPTYNFAVVVDDLEMAISHVIRGAGHLSNTPHQILLYAALGAKPPVFAHAPTVLGPDRRKLSKREGARPLAALRAEGLHPDAVVNYLSLLGWSSPSGDEVLEPARIAREVTLDRLNAGDVVFDPDKLRWLSGQHIQRMSLDDLAAAVRPHVERSPAAPLLDGRFSAALDAVRSHLTAFSEAPDHLLPLLGPAAPDAIARHAALRTDDTALGVLRQARRRLAATEPWEPDAIQGALKEAGKDAGASGRRLYLPIRVALTGEEHGPPLPAVAVVQGRQGVLDRLDAVLAAASSPS
ncbi:MAG TPA: glutamate--tRNA ligase [Longimicrobiales bacterium]|nr:glutamate--tRNA ligase [Longimicrobiales bacterium]